MHNWNDFSAFVWQVFFNKLKSKNFFMMLEASKFCSALVVCVVILTGCSKDDAAGGSTALDFGPLTANSTWTYKNNPGSSFTVTATSRDTVAAGRKYRVLLNSSGSNLYLAKAGSAYYRFGSIADLGVAAVEELYLKDDQPVNATWQITQAFIAPGIPLPLTANLNYSIKEKGITRVVSGKTFNNVINVRLDLSIVGLGNIGGGNFYYAEGVGLIENAINVTVPGQAAISQSQVLTAYSIK